MLSLTSLGFWRFSDTSLLPNLDKHDFNHNTNLSHHLEYLANPDTKLYLRSRPDLLLRVLSPAMAQRILSMQDSFPGPSQQPLAVDFLENRNNDLRDATGEIPCTFDVKRQRFVPRPAPPITQNAITLVDVELEESNMHLLKTTESFTNAINTLKTKESQNPTIKDFRLSDCNSWEEVMKTMDLAAKQYESRDTKLGKVRSAFRKVGDNGASIQAFVGLLPDGNYKTLCGGLTLILSVLTACTLQLFT
jgi:hypothetical protein